MSDFNSSPMPGNSRFLAVVTSLAVLTTLGSLTLAWKLMKANCTLDELISRALHPLPDTSPEHELNEYLRRTDV
jgi:uncharacterized membrane protein YqjE